MQIKSLISNIFLVIILCFLTTIAEGKTIIDSVLVKKLEKKMYLLQNDKIIKEYRVSFGANPAGHKEREGDERTPEGKYILDYKMSDSSFYKAIHISYPNKKDIEQARKKNVNPGGQIMIHGQKNGLGWLSIVSQRLNWTDGCIAVTNKEMEEIWELVDINTPILIE
ncbi:MAG: L,D-transpeptidase family protein [Desulfotalea sp.]